MSLQSALPYRPEDQERNEYYDGIRDHPILLARTSATPFVPNRTREEWFFDQVSKSRLPIGPHEITSIYNQEFAQDIISALGEFPWHRFYPIRMDNHATKVVENHAVFIIETLSEAEPWETSIEAALACREVIRLRGVTDVEVEIQQVNENPYAATKELDVFIDAIKCPGNLSLSARGTQETILNFETVLPYSSRLGYPIDNPKFNKAGTMGLHIRLGDDAEVSYGLTCRHVVLDEPSEPQVFGELDNSGDKSIFIRQVNAKTAKNKAIIAQQREKNLEKEHQELSEKFQRWDEWYSSTEETTEAKRSLRPTPEERELLSTLKVALSQATKVASLTHSALNQSRIIGHVAYAPSFRRSSHGHLTDWALIELDTANAFAAPPTNKVYIGYHEASKRDWDVLKLRDRGDYIPQHIEHPGLTNQLDEDGFLRISGVLPTPIDGITSRLTVGKRGMASELTFGVTNDILAVRRQFTGGGLIAWEWIVFCDKPLNSGGFSGNGDSGSAVWDHRGRFIGMVTAGGKMKEVDFAGDNTSLTCLGLECTRDLTFITPAEQLFKEIKEFTGLEPHIL